MEPHLSGCPVDQPLPLPCLSSLHPHQPASGSSCESPPTCTLHFFQQRPTRPSTSYSMYHLPYYLPMYQRSNDAERRIRFPGSQQLRQLLYAGTHVRDRCALRPSFSGRAPCRKDVRHGVPLAISSTGFNLGLRLTSLPRLFQPLGESSTLSLEAV